VAEAKLSQRGGPLLLEMELYFSCLIRKRVHVHESNEHDGALSINDKLKVRFRPVTTKTCAISECADDNPPLIDFPVVRPERYFPHWLKLDYRGGEWRADFGYATMPG